MEQLKNMVRMQQSIGQEILFANIFHDAVRGSQWLGEQPFAPGRAAIGYPTLYALYRILDEMQPRCILEMGLGESTKMIGSYVRWITEVRNEECQHFVVEHDPSWIHFFGKRFHLSKASEIVQLELIRESINETQETPTQVNLYRDFAQKLGTRKYDLVFIDGPFGSPLYSRIDILDILPECLADSFILMLDDAERAGEQNTLTMIGNVLAESNITCCVNYYSGLKATAIVTSEDMHFFCTM